MIDQVPVIMSWAVGLKEDTGTVLPTAISLLSETFHIVLCVSLATDTYSSTPDGGGRLKLTMKPIPADLSLLQMTVRVNSTYRAFVRVD